MRTELLIIIFAIGTIGAAALLRDLWNDNLSSWDRLLLTTTIILLVIQAWSTVAVLTK